MKLNKKLHLIFFIFTGMLKLYSSPTVIVINGVSCSGKTSIADTCMKLLGPEQAAFVSGDEIQISRSAEDLLDEDCYKNSLHSATIDKIKLGLKSYKCVICDTVLDDRTWVDLFKHRLGQVNLFFVFVHCPPDVLAERLSIRNRLAKQKHRKCDIRYPSGMFIAFARMYDRVNCEFGVGSFTERDYGLLKHLTTLDSRDWRSLETRFDIFNVDKMQALPFLRIKAQEEYAFIAHNYSENKELQKAEILCTISERIIGLVR